MLLKLFTFILIFILISCDKQELFITGKGKIYYFANEKIINNGRLIEEYKFSPDGLLIEKIDWDYGKDSSPVKMKFEYNKSKIMTRKVSYNKNNELYHYEDYDSNGNMVNWYLKEKRGFESKYITEYKYDENKDIAYFKTLRIRLLDGQIIKKDSVEFIKNPNNTLHKFKNTKYDSLNRLVFYGRNINADENSDSLTYVNHWIYCYNNQNLLTLKKLYLNNILQYTIKYEYYGLENLQVDKFHIKSFEKEICQ